MNLLAYDYSIELDESFCVQALVEEGLSLLTTLNEHQKNVVYPDQRLNCTQQLKVVAGYPSACVYVPQLWNIHCQTCTIFQAKIPKI